MTTARIVGFTGTRHGMTAEQAERVGDVLDVLVPDELHHGDCIGADAQADEMAYAMVVRRVAHPPSDPRHRAFCNAESVLPERPYLERDADIVAASNVMIACPFEHTEQQRSGTWATVRMARRAGKPLVIVYPQGHVTRERWEGLTP